MLITTSEKCLTSKEEARVFFYEDKSSEDYIAMFLLGVEERETLATSARSFFNSITSSIGEGEMFDGDKLKDLVGKYSSQYGELDYCLLRVSNDKISSVVQGDVQISLVRGGQIVKLLGDTEKISLVEGSLREGDSLVVSTTASVDFINKEELVGLLSQGGLKDAAEEVVAKFHAQEEDGDVGCVLIGFSTEIQEEAKFVSDIAPEKVEGGIKDKTVGVIDDVLTKMPGKGIRVGQESFEKDSKGKMKYVTRAGGVLLLVLVVSIVLGLNRRGEKIARQEYEPRLAEAKHNLEEARELSALSPPRARELVLGSKTIAEQLVSEGVEDEELDSLVGEIDESLAEIAGVYSVEPELFLDLSLISSGFSGSDIDLSDGLIRVLDSSGKRLAGVEVENKRTEIIVGPEFLPNAILTSAYANRSFILSGDGIREVTDEVNLAIKNEWDANNVLINAFAGNMYVLDKQNNQIWRHSGVRGGFLERQAWLADTVSVDFNDAVAWAIDGNVWVLSGSGELTMLSLGIPRPFSLKGVDSVFSETRDIFTYDEAKYLYILDTGNSRIMVFDKTGEFRAEYKGQGLSSAERIVVSEEEKKIIYLSSSKLFVIEARHL